MWKITVQLFPVILLQVATLRWWIYQTRQILILDSGKTKQRPQESIQPDIVIWNKSERTAFIIDVNISNDFGFNRIEWEKIKYQNLKNDLKMTWSLIEININLIVIGATHLMKENLMKYLEAIRGRPSCNKIQIAARKGTASILKREFR